MADIILKEESYSLLGACFEVYKEKGCGFHEAVYQECLAIELGLRGIPHIPKPKLALAYEGQPLKHEYEPDFVCFNQIVVELKALPHLSEQHSAQVMNYLKATSFSLGLLVNFGHHPRLEHIRIAPHDKWRPEVSPSLHH